MFGLMPRTKKSSLLPRTERPFGWIPNRLETYFDRLFGEMMPWSETPEWPYTWGLTMEEKEKEIFVRAELPGFEPAELKVEVTPELLTVEAEHKKEVEKGKEVAEREYAHAKREITLPPGIELEKVEAVYRNGVLEIHIPRKPEAVGRRIEVKT